MSLTIQLVYRAVGNTNRYKLNEKRLEEINKSSYQLQAIIFLLKTETTCDIIPIGQEVPSWGRQAVNKYRVTLKNQNHSYTFDFYDSINNTEKRISAVFDFYSVLSCLEKYTPESFDEFCSDYGYEFNNESEYIKAKSVHLACLDQVKQLRKLFNSEQLEMLSDIN